MIRVKNLLADPSVYEDYGFFVPYADAKSYTEWADSHGSKHKVSELSALKANCRSGVTQFTRTTLPAKL